MTDFNTIFPNFINQCVQLKQTLMPLAYLLLVAGLMSSVLTGQRSGDAYLRSFSRTLILVAVLTFLVPWGNAFTSGVDYLVKNVLQVDPTQIYNQYQQALQMQKTPDNNPSWWQKVFEVGATIFESIISAFLWLLGWVASAIVFYAYFLQKIILYIGYALSPIFIGFFAFGSLYDIAKRYFLNLVGIMLWPLGWGVASLVTQGLISFMTDQSFMHTGGVGGFTGYSLQNFIGVALLGVWLIFSTIAAPVIIGRSIAEGFSVGSMLVSGAASSGRSATAAAVTVGTSVASSGGGAAAIGGVVAGIGAGLESLVTSSAGTDSGSLIGSLASMRATTSGRSRDKKEVANPTFQDDDLTGDKAVAETLRNKNK